MPEILHPSNDPQSPDNEVPHFERPNQQTDAWVVVLRGGLIMAPPTCYGPFANYTAAEGFAKFLSEEVDPAVVVHLISPVLELLTWREHGR